MTAPPSPHEPGRDRQQPHAGTARSFREMLEQQGKLASRPRVKRRAMPSTQPRPRSDRPNVLWIMFDQLRADTFGFAGHPLIRTPTFDRLAAEGVTLDASYCASPLCMPSRATTMTGRGLVGHGVIDNRSAMVDDAVCFPTLLRDAGYRTANIGKTHCGRPASAIWEHHETLLEPFGATRPSKAPFDPANFPKLTFIGEPCDNSDQVLYGTYPAPAAVSETHVQTTEAMRWLYHHRDGRPFFLRVSYNMPHPPVLPPEPWDTMYDPAALPDAWFDDAGESIAQKPTIVRKYRVHRGMDRITPEDHRRHAAHYLGLVSFLDHEVERLLAYLDELGLADNTAVVLHSDHGHLLGEHGLCHKGVVLYEGVNRVPTVIRFPRRLSVGQRSSALIDGVDFAPTMLDLLGVSPAGLGERLEGRSFLPVLSGERDTHRPHVVVQWDTYGFAIRDERWKLIVYDVDDEGELYDLENDPGERHNRWSDVNCRRERDRLTAELDDWRRGCGA